LSLHLDQLHIGIIQLADDLRTPVAGKAGKFFGEVDFVGIHESLDCEGASDAPKSCPRLWGLYEEGEVSIVCMWMVLFVLSNVPIILTFFPANLLALV